MLGASPVDHAIERPKALEKLSTTLNASSIMTSGTMRRMDVS